MSSPVLPIATTSMAGKESTAEPGRKRLLMGLGTFYHTGTLLSKAAIIVSVLTMMKIICTLHPNVSEMLPRLSRAVPDTKCVIYDRPPRTGSSTISKALGVCLRNKGYKVAKNRERKRSTVILDMLSFEADRIAMASTHLALTGSDMRLLKENCREMLYLTSASPMKKRLLSALKYKQAAAAGDPHSNETIQVDMAEVAKNNLKKNRKQEAFLEAYPHVTDDKMPLDVIPERIVPDYVILKKTLEHDLRAVLHALGCNATFSSINVHRSTTDEDMALESITLHGGDVMHKWLSEVAMNNDKGLRKARSF